MTTAVTLVTIEMFYGQFFCVIQGIYICHFEFNYSLIPSLPQLTKIIYLQEVFGF